MLCSKKAPSPCGSFSLLICREKKGLCPMDERFYDAMLNIKTTGDQKGFNQSYHYHRYEPTPYSALKLLFQNYEIKSTDRMVDFGCGKGRLNFYLHYFFNASVVGIEMNRTFYQEAMENKEGYLKKHKNGHGKVYFHHCLAEEYEICSMDNYFYFFNPFSIQIFTRVVNHILESVENEDREITLILFYPSADYIFYLENNTSFQLKEEIILPGKYEHNQNERFLIYRL
jgi:SAM-dependent methyltransferase